MKVVEIITNRKGDFDNVTGRFKSNKIHTLNYIFCDGKTVTKKLKWNEIISGYHNFRKWLESERSQGCGDLNEDIDNHLRCLSNEGIYIYSFLKTYGNTLKNRNILKQYTTETDLIKCIKGILKGSRRNGEILNWLYSTRMYIKFLECEDITETVVNLHDIPSFELLDEKQKDLRLKEIESYQDENSNNYWKKQEIVKRRNYTWNDFKRMMMTGGITTSFGMETSMETIH